ncbi:hypothetical protein HYS47_05530 [Candidatus Woesearchaeota archaeon]|nr:hypothetical protein [Candidatus Woesearchaeota archaeon]
MKPILKTRLRFIGRNIARAEKLSLAEKRKLLQLFHHETSSHQWYGVMVDRTLLHLLHELKVKYSSFATSLQPLVGEYHTLIHVLKEQRNYSSEVFQRYEDVLRQLQRQDQQVRNLVKEMKHVKQYIELHQHFSAKHFHEECKTVFNGMQRELVDVYEPVMSVAGKK